MPESEKRVVVAIPCGEHVHAIFANALAEMLLHTVSCDLANSLTCTVRFYSSSILPYSRMILAQYALDLNFTHVLYIDSDMQFPPQMLARFLALPDDKKIVGINAMSRRPPFRCTAQEAPGVQVITGPESTGLERVFRTGFGVVWVATEVFRSMPEPWFDFEFQPEFRVFKGEDYRFCERARAAGHEVWIDHDLSKLVEHLGTFGYSPLLHDLLSIKPAPAAPTRGNGGEAPAP